MDLLQPDPNIQNNLIPAEPKKSRKIWFMYLGIAIVVLLSASAYGTSYYWQKSQPKVCTQEAKLCSDGSSVGRTEPNCEFAACPSASPSSSVVADATADWQTYRNDKYGFEVKYPSALRVWENQQLGTGAIYSVSFENTLAYDNTPGTKVVTAGRKIVFNVSIYKNSNQMQDEFKTVTLREQGNTILGGYSAKKLLSPQAPNNIEATVYLIADKNTAIITYGTDLNKMSEKDISQILSTFKFTDSAAGWQTYRNEQYGFEVKYPNEASVISFPKSGGIAYVGTNVSGLNVFNYGVSFDNLGTANNLSVENWYAQYCTRKKQEAASSNAPFFLSENGQNIQLNSYASYKTIDFGVDHFIVNFYIVHNGNVYKLSYSDEKANDPNWYEHEKIINQILSTFKFTK